ncbi:MAG: glycosyl hydrolase 53 family protein [Ferruginibacter sp.]|nr:glycosyl hydrolase 53 family protein [Ferruginibacter sp.]
MKIHLLFAFFLLITSIGCNKSGNVIPGDRDSTAFFAKGADVSWLTEMEAQSQPFINLQNQPQECMSLLKDMGMNAIRLRVWVNPADGYNGLQDVLAKAARAKNLGMQILIDFHYSDTWADPGHQQKPASWVPLNFNQLLDSVYAHTRAVLLKLQQQGCTPAWVQVGNETNDGLLWEDGRASTHMANYAQLFKKGYDAVKSVDENMKVIVHLSNGFDNNLYRWNLDGLKDHGATWDVVGISLYPTTSNWQSLNQQCMANMNDMVSRYGSEVMVTETGMSWTDSASCKQFLTDLIQKTKQVSQGKGLGVFYWEPEAHNNWKGYTLGAFNNQGKPTLALTAFN